MSSYKTRNRKFKKNIAKKLTKFKKEKKKHYYGIFSTQNKLGKAEKERK